MNYIGSKHKLSSFIKTAISETVNSDLSELVFCDLFAGTGIVGRNFKSSVKEVIANDVEYYSYVLNRNYIGNFKSYNYAVFINSLNNLDGVKGFIFENYAEGGKEGRLYFLQKMEKKLTQLESKLKTGNFKVKLMKTCIIFF